MTKKETPQQPRWGWGALWAVIMSAPRVILVGLLILGIFGVFTRRLWKLQFVEGEYYRQRASRQSTRSIVVPAPRGIIYDRNGMAIVRNVPSFYVTIVPAYLPESEDDESEGDGLIGSEAESVLIRLALMLDMPYVPSGNEEDPQPALHDMVEDALESGAFYRPLVVKRNVERDKALLVAQQTPLLPGVSVEVESVRYYPYGTLLSQVLGYLLPIPEEAEDEYREQGYDPATDRIGVAGVEATYEDALRGEKGQQIVEEDVLGRVIRVIEEQAEPEPGSNVYLTLDLELQQFVEGELWSAMSDPEVESPRGVVIVMNPQTGEILSMVSLPSYDNNLFIEGVSISDWDRWAEDPHRPLLNHAVMDGLPPGSVFKVVVATAALQEGIVTPQTELNCPGKVIVPNKYYPNDPGRAQPFYCWNQAGHGYLDIIGGIAHSCDIFFYKIGGGFEETDFDGLGVNKIAEYARMFGMGEPTGVELPAEIGGLVPTSEWKRKTYRESWSTGDTYNLSIGQGFLSVTPLQMLNAVNVVANGGTLYRPTLIHQVVDAQGVVTQTFEPDVVHELPVDEENLELVKQGMVGAMEYGTAAKRGQIEGLSIAGKTGTAQFCDDIMCGVGFEQPEHAWFSAFAPVEDPEVSVIVFLYNGGEGSVTAVPVAREILEYYFGVGLDEGEEEGA